MMLFLCALMSPSAARSVCRLRVEGGRGGGRVERTDGHPNASLKLNGSTDEKTCGSKRYTGTSSKHIIGKKCVFAMIVLPTLNV